MTRPIDPFLPRLALLLGCTLTNMACRTRAAAVDAIAGASQRLVVTPNAIAVLTQARSLSGLPGEIAFGASRGRSALYLQFPTEWRAHGAPLRGFLALEPRLGETPDAEPITIEAWRVSTAWQASDLQAWSDKPALAPPFARAVISSSPARELRIDITDLLRFAANNPALDQGLALIARGGSGHGVSFATGISGGSPPKLEIYAR